MRNTRDRGRFKGSAGFTMTELAVVVGIIALMGAVAMPNLLAYIRNYAIETAAKDVASEIQSARYKAISRNVNLGVLFHIPDATSYVWIMEDDATPQSANPADNWSAHGTETEIPALLGFADQHGSRKLLPNGVQFDATGASDPAVRFNRFGGWCQPGVDLECPVPGGFSGTDYVLNDAAGATVQLVQPSTGLRRTLRIGTGGRVVIE